MDELYSQIESLNNYFNNLNTMLTPDIIFQIYSPMSVKLRKSLSTIINKIGNISWTGEYIQYYEVNDDDPNDIHITKDTGTITVQKTKKHIIKCDGTITKTDIDVPNIYLFGGMNWYMINDYLIEICKTKKMKNLNFIVPRSGDYDFKIHLVDNVTNFSKFSLDNLDIENISRYPEIDNILKQIMIIVAKTLSTNIPTESSETKYILNAIKILSQVTNNDFKLFEINSDKNTLLSDIKTIDPDIRDVIPINNFIFASISYFRVQINIKISFFGKFYIEHICEFMLDNAFKFDSYFPVYPMYFDSKDIRWSIPVQIPNETRILDLVKTILNRSWGKYEDDFFNWKSIKDEEDDQKNMLYKPERRCMKDIERFYWIYYIYINNILKEKPDDLDKYKCFVDISKKKCKNWSTIASKKYINRIQNIYTKFINERIRKISLPPK